MDRGCDPEGTRTRRGWVCILLVIYRGPGLEGTNPAGTLDMRVL